MKILVLFGPNLNRLEKRNPIHYGDMTLEDLCDQITKKFSEEDFTFFQSNHEGELIDIIQYAEEYDAILINAAAYTHTSVAIRDALELYQGIKVSVHLSNIKEREHFRKQDFLEDICEKTFMGKQIESYFEALSYITSQKTLQF